MNAMRQLQDLGQSIWLDNITRELLTSGTLLRYLRELSVTGLTSNPTIFEKAVSGADSYDAAIQQKAAAGMAAEALLYELALDDLTQAADLFRPIHDATGGVDGWVSLEVSPLLASDTAASIAAAVRLHSRADRPNLFVKIPGTRAGIPAIEELVFRGVPVNVTLLFSPEQYLAAAESYIRGIERRQAAGRDLRVASVASFFVSRWDAAGNPHLPANLHNRLGMAVASQVYGAYRQVLGSPRWRKLGDAGAHPQRLLWASTATKDPAASDTIYVSGLAAPDTINTMPEGTLRAFADHGRVSSMIADEGRNADDVFAAVRRVGLDTDAMAARLQDDGADAFVTSWQRLLAEITSKANPSAAAPPISAAR